MPTATLPIAATGTRETQPSGVNPYNGGGMGYIVNRNDSAGYDGALHLTDMLGMLAESPLRTLARLAHSHPTMSQSMDNLLGMLYPPGDLRITAKITAQDGTKTDDPEGTAAINSLWERGMGVAGLGALARNQTRQHQVYGMACLEGVPAERDNGVASWVTVDPLTIKLSWADGLSKPLVAFQRQSGNVPLKRLNPETFFWTAFDGDTDNPYGVPRLGAFLNVGMRDINRMRDLDSSLHQAGHPMMVILYSLKELLETAQSLGIGNTQEMTAWALARIADVQKSMSTKQADDTMVLTGADAKTIQGSFMGLEPVLDRMAREMTQSLKTRPFLLGVNDSTTETQAREQYKVEAAGLEYVRSAGVVNILRLANLELRLRGRPSVAEAEYTPIRTTDALVEAQTDKIVADIMRLYVRYGWLTSDEACQRTLGQPPSGEPLPGAWDPPATQAANEPSEPAPPPDGGQEKP